VSLLFRLRGLPSQSDQSLWDGLQRIGFRSVDELTLLGEGRPWRLRERLRVPPEGGYARIAVDVSYEDGRLATETRVALTDPAARRAFRRYWLVIRPFSGLVRRSWLRAARRRALDGG
jgi:hypothetical protein